MTDCEIFFFFFLRFQITVCFHFVVMSIHLISIANDSGPSKLSNKQTKKPVRLIVDSFHGVVFCVKTQSWHSVTTQPPWPCGVEYYTTPTVPRKQKRFPPHIIYATMVVHCCLLCSLDKGGMKINTILWTSNLFIHFNVFWLEMMASVVLWL